MRIICQSMLLKVCSFAKHKKGTTKMECVNMILKMLVKKRLINRTAKLFTALAEDVFIMCELIL